MKTVYIIGVNIEKKDHIGFWNLHPFNLYKKQFRDAGYEIYRVHAQTTREIYDAFAKIGTADIIIFRPNWTENPGDVTKLAQHIRDNLTHSKVILADPFDQTNSRFFGCLPYVDAVLKYQCLRDRNMYLKKYEKDCYALDRLKKEAGISVNKEWDLSSGVPSGQENKIVSGSFVVEPKLIRQTHSKLYQWRVGRINKNVDVFCHVSCGERNKPDWYGKHRLSAIDKLKSLSRYNLSVAAEFAGEQRLSPREYSSRLRQAKIMFAPLGWGEVTMRSYEAIANQCLLIQPDISHMEVFPNVFQPNETYVPVKWDLSDLAEKCEYFLENDEARMKIIANARAKFIEEYRSERFVASCLRIF